MKKDVRPEECEDLLKRIQAEEHTLGLLLAKKAADQARHDSSAVRDDIEGIDIANQILAGLRRRYSDEGCGEEPLKEPFPNTKNMHLFVSNFGKTSSILRFNGITGAFMGVFAEVFPNDDPASYISDLVLGVNDDLYALIPNYQKLIVINGSNGAFHDFAASTLIAWARPNVVAYGLDKNFYIGDTGAQIEMVIGKFSGSTGSFMGEIIQPSQHVIGGGDLICGFDGKLYNACFYNDNRIMQIDPVSGARRVFASTAAAGIIEDGPGSMAFGPDGDLFVGTGIEANRRGIAAVLRFDGTSGTYKGIFIPAQSGGLEQAVSLAFGPAPSHDLFVANRDGGILQFNGKTGAFKKVFIPHGRGGLASPGKLVFRAV